MALIRLVRKTLTVHRKSVKTVKVFFCIGFVVYLLFVTIIFPINLATSPAVLPLYSEMPFYKN